MPGQRGSMGNSASIPSTSQSRRTGGLGDRRRTLRPLSWAHRWAVIKAPTPQAAINRTPEASITRSDDPVVRASNRPQRSSGAVSRSTSPTNQSTVGAPVDRGVPGPDPSMDTTRRARSTVGERAPIDGLAVESRDPWTGGPARLPTPSTTTGSRANSLLCVNSQTRTPWSVVLFGEFVRKGAAIWGADRVRYPGPAATPPRLWSSGTDGDQRPGRHLRPADPTRSGDHRRNHPHRITDVNTR